MNNHLSQDQITEWVSGTQEESVRHHLEGCELCGAEVEGLQKTFSCFRDTVHAMAQQDDGYWRRQQFTLRKRLAVGHWFSPGYWVWATALLVVLVTSLLLMRTPTIPRYGTTEADDEILLQQVQGDVSREFPEALAPAVLIAEERNEILGRKTNSPSKSNSKEGVQ
jgi:hypothetical protein